MATVVSFILLWSSSGRFPDSFSSVIHSSHVNTLSLHDRKLSILAITIFKPIASLQGSSSAMYVRVTYGISSGVGGAVMGINIKRHGRCTGVQMPISTNFFSTTYVYLHILSKDVQKTYATHTLNCCKTYRRTMGKRLVVRTCIVC